MSWRKAFRWGRREVDIPRRYSSVSIDLPDLSAGTPNGLRVTQAKCGHCMAAGATGSGATRTGALTRSYRSRARKKGRGGIQHGDGDALARCSPDDREDRPSGGEEPGGARAGVAAHAERGCYP